MFSYAKCNYAKCRMFNKHADTESKPKKNILAKKNFVFGKKLFRRFYPYFTRVTRRFFFKPPNLFQSSPNSCLTFVCQGMRFCVCQAARLPLYLYVCDFVSKSVTQLASLSLSLSPSISPFFCHHITLLYITLHYLIWVRLGYIILA
jgi:hypothetical protein